MAINKAPLERRLTNALDKQPARIENESQFRQASSGVAVHNVIPLHHLQSGTHGRVVDVVGRPEQVRRIHELGLRDGAEVQMVRPGVPCIVRLAGQTLAFRANELLGVLVEPRAAS